MSIFVAVIIYMTLLLIVACLFIDSLQDRPQLSRQTISCRSCTHHPKQPRPRCVIPSRRTPARVFLPIQNCQASTTAPQTTPRANVQHLLVATTSPHLTKRSNARHQRTTSSANTSEPLASTRPTTARKVAQGPRPVLYPPPAYM